MIRSLSLLLALLWPGAVAAPLCRVTAESRPGIWTSALRNITVRLAPDCPPDGIALIHLGQYGGPGSKGIGPAVRLSAAWPAVTFGGQPRYRTVLWEAGSGRLYQVQIPQEVNRQRAPKSEDE